MIKKVQDKIFLYCDLIKLDLLFNENLLLNVL